MVIYKKIKLFTIFIINCLVTFVSFFIPKTNKIVIIGGWFGDRFCDNSAELYKQLNKDNYFKHVIWITKNKNILNMLREQKYEAYYYSSLKSIWYHFRAKTHIVDQSHHDINPIFSVRANKINLYHGLGLKRVGLFCSKDPKEFSISNKLKKHPMLSIGCWSSCYYLAASNFGGQILTESFNLLQNHIIFSSFPRVKVLLEGQTCEQLINCNKKIIFYVPTFREEQDNLDWDKFLNKINAFCLKNDCIFACKLHYASKVDLNKFQHLYPSTIIFINKDYDLTSILKYCDLLVTDYSSVAWDYLLLKRPVIFFPYDLVYYENKERGFYKDYRSTVPGKIVYDIENLLLELQNAMKDLGSYYLTRNEIKKENIELFNQYQLPYNIDNLVSFIKTK